MSAFEKFMDRLFGTFLGAFLINSGAGLMATCIIWDEVQHKNISEGKYWVFIMGAAVITSLGCVIIAYVWRRR